MIKIDDLVLKVSDNVDLNLWDESKFLDFLDILCGNRYYQKEAILTAIKFIAGGSYCCTADLAKENFDLYNPIKEKYVTYSNLLSKLYFSNTFSATIDLATGTGKSWVIYGIARIARDFLSSPLDK